ncbi:hypothetical protein [Roseovarius nanhaiticus]|uniref:hypothetical protein n=1 Tax=Roseovarius nanhaiticus TaxID=573024 RepID=UPI002491BCD0|nr:hypothetical protein [Roseovarius nanhaiticus]
MQKLKMIAMGCGTLALALGAGHFMQSRQAAVPVAQEGGTSQLAGQSGDIMGTRQSGAVQLSSITLTAASPELPATAPTPDVLPQPPAIREAALNDPSATTVADALPTEEPAPSLSCDYTLRADVAPGAMVALSLDAPCAPGERFTMHHNGMMFTQVTDDGGHASMLVPALARNASFIAAFSNGDGAVANAEVESLDIYQRVAVQWQGETGVQLHALEFGADYGGEGHVWSGAARDVAAAAGGDLGFLTRLGDADQPDALMAEVYTFPSQLAGRDGDIALQVEAEVTDVNCNTDIETQALQMQAGGALKVQDVVLMMPECDAVGDFLVLKNLLNDLTIARN